MKLSLIGLDLKELEEVASGGGMPRFVGRQLAQWIYGKRVVSFDEMINISRRNREWLAERYEVGRKPPLEKVKSADGTVKYLYPAGERQAVEAVYIPDKDRTTLCVSSQVGCKMNCYFCATGRMGFKAQLTAAQIVNQILSSGGADGLSELTNIVFMGMGEPLDNIQAVMKAIEILTSPWGLGWSPKRITVSTVGKLPELKELLDRTSVHIAVSVHTPDARERAQIMPAQKAFPLSSVMKLLSAYDFSHQRRLSLEYIMWKGVNDDIAHAEGLVKLIGNMKCRVNLIRYHSISGVDLQPCSDERMLMMRNYLNNHGIVATIRASRGEDILAACGMLSTARRKS